VDTTRDRITDKQALGRVAAASSVLMRCMGFKADEWDTDWIEMPRDEVLDVVKHRIYTAIGYIEEHR
jgi:hypothetical protein